MFQRRMKKVIAVSCLCICTQVWKRCDVEDDVSHPFNVSFLGTFPFCSRPGTAVEVSNSFLDLGKEGWRSTCLPHRAPGFSSQQQTLGKSVLPTGIDNTHLDKRMVSLGVAVSYDNSI